MKKTLVSLAFGLFLTGTVTTTASAEDYQVVKGDSLWEIAQSYDTTVLKLKEWNKLDSDLIHPKQEIEINNQISYNVEKGDTLSHIAQDHNVTVEKIKKWNNLTTDLIVVGQDLTIKEQGKVAEESTKASTVSTKKESEPEAVATSTGNEVVRELTVKATAYTAECEGCSGITYTGINLNEDRNAKVIAVDPDVIPLGSRVYVEGYGEAIAGDIGGAIDGHHIDIHVPTKEEAFDWGVRTVNVQILG
ncbi:LysM peptidoglycan-binding domain-containing protein [Radiobacillus kanasensis]|uniref:LysM peptidoglycan-binding and 3D domain-containing protein n=1 Tax=Radiobacillus kanasensis TaxID=2844358 RepID=UPI001E5E5712|nr:3D domain-containing protein [Radiobacillus kanasensis]UFT99073.1 LysM peptidoglycan-binding domain-containing protein [Radiobacillus kanasensis]